MKRESEWQKLEEKLIILEHENERLKFERKHLMESEFIKSFIIQTPNGQWQRPIDEADKVAYWKGLINASIPPSDGGIFELQKITTETTTETIQNVIINPKAIIVKCKDIRLCDIERIKKQFKELELNAIVIPYDCDIDYIC